MISLFTYSFGLIKWSNTVLEGINRILRTEMTGHRIRHRNSVIERIVLPRLKRVSAVLDVHRMCASQVSQLREYFYNKRHVPLYKNICREYNGYILLLHRSLHGQHLLVPDQSIVIKEASNLWLRRGELFPETEGFVVAIQDKVIGTRYYQKHILRHNVDKCRSKSSKSVKTQAQ